MGDRDVRRTMRVVLVAAGAALGLSAWAAELPVGIPVEDGPLGLALRLAALLAGAFLLFSGRRFERATVAAFALLVGLAAGVGLLGQASYGLGFLAAWLLAVVALLVHAFAPRVAFGFAGLWPLPALYGYWVFSAGEFTFSRVLALGLAVAGALLGAALPKIGAALLSAALGTVLLALASPWELPFWAVAALAGAGLLVQLFVLPLFVSAPAGWPGDDSLGAKRQRWLKASRITLLLLVLAALAVGLLAPRVAAGGAPYSARLEKAGAGGALARPGLLFDPLDAYYLSGRAVRFGLVGGTGTFWDRLALPILGRNCGETVHRVRAVKEPAELEAMRRAGAITSAAFADAAAVIRPGASEKDVERAVVEGFAKRGATGLAFPCVVGSGPNATAPHYMANDARMDRGLVVVDIGCMVDGYASDMTRTFPVTGRYTAAERKLMETVVAAHEAARVLLKAGATYSALDKAARDVIEKAGFGKYFIHSLGHPVGLDVHDPYRDKLEAGMVVTIEPGIYIPAGSEAPREFWDLGVRVEDSYLVTAGGCEALTSYPQIPGEAGAPVTPDP